MEVLREKQREDDEVGEGEDMMGGWKRNEKMEDGRNQKE